MFFALFSAFKSSLLLSFGFSLIRRSSYYLSKNRGRLSLNSCLAGITECIIYGSGSFPDSYEVSFWVSIFELVRLVDDSLTVGLNDSNDDNSTFPKRIGVSSSFSFASGIGNIFISVWGLGWFVYILTFFKVIVVPLAPGLSTYLSPQQLFPIYIYINFI